MEADEDLRNEDEVLEENAVADKNTNVSREKTETEKNLHKELNKKVASSRASSHLDKKTQQMLAELHRLKIQMFDAQQSIHRPPVKPYTPDIFNSLSPYYNRYMINYIIKDLQEAIPAPKGYHHRSTALGVIEPEISWRMDNFPAPFHQSRLPSRLFRAMTWSRNMGPQAKQSHSRQPPLPMPNFPKFNQPAYQPHRMTYDQLASFRGDIQNAHGRLAKQQAEADYERTIQEWNRMNLSELKKLPSDKRHHVKKAIMSYMGTSQGSTRALKPLTRELDATSPRQIEQQ